MYGRSVDDALRLNLTPGRHTIRVAFTPEGPDPQGKRPRVVSLPVEIEVVRMSGETAAETPLPKMIPVSSDVVGITFDRPADWIVDKDPPPHNGPGVGFVQPWSLVDGLQASLRVSMAENGGKASIDVTSPPPTPRRPQAGSSKSMASPPD